MVVLLGAFALTNPLGLDWHQRISGCIAVLAIAYFVTYTMDKTRSSETKVPVPEAVATPQEIRTPPTSNSNEHDVGQGQPSGKLNNSSDKKKLKDSGKNMKHTGDQQGGIRTGDINNSNVTFGNNSPIIQGPVLPPPRTLTENKFKQLVTELTNNSALQIEITVVPSDDESSAFANQITRAFQQAGWSSTLSSIGSMNMTIFDGTKTIVFNGDGFHCGGDRNSVEFKKAMQAFAAVGLSCAVSSYVRPESGPFAIVIGKRIPQQ